MPLLRLCYRKAVASFWGGLSWIPLALQEAKWHTVKSVMERLMWQETDVSSQQPAGICDLSQSKRGSKSCNPALRWVLPLPKHWLQPWERLWAKGTQLSQAGHAAMDNSYSWEPARSTRFQARSRLFWIRSSGGGASNLFIMPSRDYVARVVWESLY